MGAALRKDGGGDLLFFPVDSASAHRFAHVNRWKTRRLIKKRELAPCWEGSFDGHAKVCDPHEGACLLAPAAGPDGCASSGCDRKPTRRRPKSVQSASSTCRRSTARAAASSPSARPATSRCLAACLTARRARTAPPCGASQRAQPPPSPHPAPQVLRPRKSPCSCSCPFCKAPSVQVHFPGAKPSEVWEAEEADKRRYRASLASAQAVSARLRALLVLPGRLHSRPACALRRRGAPAARVL
jgi:hypothetical protein